MFLFCLKNLSDDSLAFVKTANLGKTNNKLRNILQYKNLTYISGTKNSPRKVEKVTKAMLQTW